MLKGNNLTMIIGKNIKRKKKLIFHKIKKKYLFKKLYRKLKK